VSKTTIEWTDYSFNIAWGCIKVSPGCANCYAETLANRYGYKVWGPAKTTARRVFGDKHWGEPLKWNKAAEKAGERRRVFCSSMADVFEDHPTIDAEREKLWPLIRATPWLDWQLLTKRPERIAANLPADWGTGYDNVWLGASIETQDYIERIVILGDIPARVRFVSAEPLLGPVSLRSFWELLEESEVWWLIVGGESGAGCRPMDLDWVRTLRHECIEFGVAFFLKQLGGSNPRGHHLAVLDGMRHTEMPDRDHFAAVQP
jgi:protein gp37